MSCPSDADPLATARLLTLVLRLVFDDTGCLSHGELIDTSTSAIKRFGRSQDLQQVIHDHLSHSNLKLVPD